MNKKLISFLLACVLALNILPGIAFAANDGCKISDPAKLSDTNINCGTASGMCYYSETGRNCGVCCVLNTVYVITDWVFAALMLASVVVIVLAGFKMVTAEGSADKVGEARQSIVYAAVGIAVAFLARAVPLAVKFILGGS
ncbi:MAG: hypothetical protein WC397_01715 [Candidatus Paceibacterota bacterium]|jgi:hypothetical protein